MNPFGVTVFQALVTASYSGITHSSQIHNPSTRQRRTFKLLAALGIPSNLYQPLITLPVSQRLTARHAVCERPHLIDRLPYRMHASSPFEQTFVPSRFRPFCSLTRRALTSAFTASPDRPRHENTYPEADADTTEHTRTNTQYSIQVEIA